MSYKLRVGDDLPGIPQYGLSTTMYIRCEILVPAKTKALWKVRRLHDVLSNTAGANRCCQYLAQVLDFLHSRVNKPSFYTHFHSTHHSSSVNYLSTAVINSRIIAVMAPLRFHIVLFLLWTTSVGLAAATSNPAPSFLGPIWFERLDYNGTDIGSDAEDQEYTVSSWWWSLSGSPCLTVTVQGLLVWKFHRGPCIQRDSSH